jgi:hypothetical protein
MSESLWENYDAERELREVAEFDEIYERLEGTPNQDRATEEMRKNRTLFLFHLANASTYGVLENIAEAVLGDEPTIQRFFNLIADRCQRGIATAMEEAAYRRVWKIVDELAEAVLQGRASDEDRDIVSAVGRVLVEGPAGQAYLGKLKLLGTH